MKLARELASARLGADVERHDDGCSDSMPDASITYPDDRRGWLEVVADRDPGYEARWDAVQPENPRRERRGDLQLNGLRWGWIVNVRHDVISKGVERWLGPLLQQADGKTTPPGLPEGAAHPRLAGSGSADRAVAWFPDRGWHEVTPHWTETPRGVEIARAHEERRERLLRG